MLYIYVDDLSSSITNNYLYITNVVNWKEIVAKQTIKKSEKRKFKNEETMENQDIFLSIKLILSIQQNFTHPTAVHDKLHNFRLIGERDAFPISGKIYLIKNNLLNIEY